MSWTASPRRPPSRSEPTTPHHGATAVYYDGSDTPYLAHFTSADSSYGLKAEGQTLVWSELYRVAFYDENNRHRYGYLYIVPGSTIDESQIPGGVPTKEGYSLLGWRALHRRLLLELRHRHGDLWPSVAAELVEGRRPVGDGLRLRHGGPSRRFHHPDRHGHP